MATINVDPRVVKNIVLTIGTDDFRKHVDSAVLTPSASAVTWTGSGLNTFTDSSTATWTLALSYAQDWETSNSLSRYLFDNEGQRVPYTYQLTDGSGDTFAGTAIITPGAAGAAVNAVANATVTLGLTAKPTRTVAGAVPTLVSATPASQGAGKIVTISGSRFTGTTAVTFGGTAAAAFSVLSDSTLVATLPAGSAGSAAIIVTNATGASTSLPYTRVV